MPQPRYDFAGIEQKAQRLWEEQRIFQADDTAPKRFYCLEMFPYPSGRLHMGHMRVYTIGDCLTRFLRMNGYNVLHPIGWDAFGLPAEQAAEKHQVHPYQWTKDCIAHMKGQMKMIGFGYDWSREIATCEPEYYRWTQWLFLKLYERGLAYRAKTTVNWSETLQCVLANEQVIDGKDWRTGNPVVQKEMDGWFLKITAYADEILEWNRKLPGWPQDILAQQDYWIGRSTGAEVDFPLVEGSGSIRIFTTRPDTLYGATFMVLAAAHPLLDTLVTDPAKKAELEELREFVRQQKVLSPEQRSTEKRGVFTGAFALNPLTKEHIPVWASNFVLMEYGTGAIMSVPAHDQRDFEFAKQFGLTIRVVIQNPEGTLESATLEAAYEPSGPMVESADFNGLIGDAAKAAVIAYLESLGIGTGKTTYKLRDWGISRQRYWGCPIPLIYCDSCGVVPVPEEQLPVRHPVDVVISTEGGNPLARHQAFVHTACPKCGAAARRETDTMDTFIDSSWYFLRYASPREVSAPISKAGAAAWMPVSQYVGGREHAILHLLYARFIHKACRDMGLVDCDEPFTNLLAQGMVIKGGAKMSKSLGNVVDPDALVQRYGSDTVRLFSLFAAPPEKDLDWSDQGVVGCFRLLNKVHDFVVETWPALIQAPDEVPAATALSGEARELHRLTHVTIQRVTRDIGERRNFNTAVAAIMEFYNGLSAFKLEGVSSRETSQCLTVAKEATRTLVQVLAPFAPHLAEELWMLTGGKQSIFLSPWPSWREESLVAETVEVPVQINGKVRGTLSVPPDITREALEQTALTDEKILKWTDGKAIAKVIVVGTRLVNVVVKN